MQADAQDTVHSVGPRELGPYDGSPAAKLNGTDNVENYLTELLLSSGSARSKFLAISNNVLTALEKTTNKQDSPSIYDPRYYNGPVEIAITRLSIAGIETRNDETSSSQNITQCNLFDYESITLSVTPTGKANIYANLALVFISTIICTGILLWFLMRYITPRRRESSSMSFLSQLSNYNSQDSGLSQSSTSPTGRWQGPTISDTGQLCIGKITFDPKNVLGHGCQGTCVFKGDYENSQVCAVKRVVSQYLSLADREINHLRTLQHPNVVRYLATEEDIQFIYIAIELAEFTLADLIEKRLTNAEADKSLMMSNLDLWHQSALGLKYLHNMDVIHRDIKPQNILISFPLKPGNKRKVMISDFGMCKRITNPESAYSSSISRYLDGTNGWIAAEIMSARLSNTVVDLRPSKSIDIFALGCVFYYIHTNGRHPFGESLDRQSNIIKGINKIYGERKTVTNDGRLPEGGPSKDDADILITYLISTMISHKAEHRPPIDAVLSYPLFWSRAQQLQFLQDVSDRIEKLEYTNEIVSRIETGRVDVVQLDWHSQLGAELQDDLRKFRTYKKYSVRDLLRAIRNKKNHYRELPAALRQSLGDIPEGYTNYFVRRFPRLLPHVYLAAQTLRDETIFQAYYRSGDDHRRQEMESSTQDVFVWPELPRSSQRVIL